MFRCAYLSKKRFRGQILSHPGLHLLFFPPRPLLLSFSPKTLSQLYLLLFHWLYSHPLTHSTSCDGHGVGGWVYLSASLLFIYIYKYKPNVGSIPGCTILQNVLWRNNYIFLLLKKERGGSCCGIVG